MQGVSGDVLGGIPSILWGWSRGLGTPRSFWGYTGLHVDFWAPRGSLGFRVLGLGFALAGDSPAMLARGVDQPIG